MLITIQNLSDGSINAHTYPSPSKFNINRTKKLNLSPSSTLQLASSSSTTTILPKGFRREIILQQTALESEGQRLNSPSGEGAELLSKEWDNHPEGLKVRLSLAGPNTWQVVRVPDSCPWRIFISKVTRTHQRLTILNRRNLATFLSELPDRLPLSSVLLPGTHDTMAFHGWPISQCQSPLTPLTTQLHAGIRILDIRLAVIPPPTQGATTLDPAIKHELIAYHGLWPQQTPFIAMLTDIHTFLSSPIGCKETIVMSMKQEDYAITPTPIFSELVKKTLVSGPGGWDDSKSSKTGVNRGMWFLENRIPKLGEVRGKVIMLSRFGGNGAGWENGLEGLGIHPTTWPDSEKEGFEWELKGTRVRTHDWYAIPSFLSIPEKVKLGTTNLFPPPPGGPPTLPITYFSAASIPFALPPVIALGFGWPKWGIGFEGVNSKLGSWLLEKLGEDPPNSNAAGDVEKQADSRKMDSEPRIRGWTFLDYYSEPEGCDLVPLLVECNFRGRRSGEEGW